MLRSELISELANRILDLKILHPIRVGVSGITASGKTTLANELAKELQEREKHVVRTSIDQFHNPRVIRYRQGKESAIGYYEDAHDYNTFKEKLLIPLGPGGNRQYQPISLDLEKDEYVNTEAKLANKATIFIIDGTFLFKEELRDLFDYKIFVDTDFELARKRGSKREEQAFGSYEKAEEIFLKRYHAASKLYLEQHEPKLHGDVVIDNNDIEHPFFVNLPNNSGGIKLKITTERLILTAFNLENYKKITETYSGKHIINYIEKLKNDPELLGWGVWYATLAENTQIIGDLGFKGKPGEKGIVEVGYGIIPEMQNKGIATEAVNAIVNWGFSSPSVQKVVAECLEDNIPSIKVLEKIGMKKTDTLNGMIYWEKKR